MAKFPRQVCGGVTDLQGDTIERMMLVHSTTEAAVIRRALNEMFLREQWFTVEQLAADHNRSKAATNGH